MFDKEYREELKNEIAEQLFDLNMILVKLDSIRMKIEMEDFTTVREIEEAEKIMRTVEIMFKNIYMAYNSISENIPPELVKMKDNLMDNMFDEMKELGIVEEVEDS